MSEKPKFTIEVVKEEDADEFYENIKEYFLKDEPTCKYLGITHLDEVKKYFEKSLPQKCSFKAVDENGKIIGVVANEVQKRPSENDPIKTATEMAIDERWKKICMLFDRISENYNIFKEYPEAKFYLAGKAVAVNPKYRGLGIAGELIKKTIEFMKENNIEPMLRICSSAYSARVMEKLNMTEVYKINYKDFIVNGEQLLKPESPHVCCRVFVLEVKN
ncbi:arylalkylamine N-acetyltransferase 1-like [Condylostylus longicornis]|uniref:arylalkylamine N-acetyltransferase 1-like n=1 Tax=Condylostylus longicornis TaxID=2530218 RepID=UPI00244DB4D2|nr:arylalkylamine N-acetyltransferase 1-like [Condylostylus longicornis]